MGSACRRLARGSWVAAMLAVATRASPAEDAATKRGAEPILERISAENASRVELAKSLSGPTDWARCLAWQPGSSRLYAGCKDGLVYIWDVKNDELPMRVRVAHC